MPWRREENSIVRSLKSCIFHTEDTIVAFSDKIIAVVLDHKKCGRKDENDPNKKIKEKTLQDLLHFS